jgi:hypothetical protein
MGSKEIEIVKCEIGTIGRDGLVTGYSTTYGRLGLQGRMDL